MQIRLSTLALFLVPAALAAQAPRYPKCEASRDGERLITTVTYPSGYLVQGPWRVVNHTSGPSRPSTITAVLDRVIEFDPSTRERLSTPFPSAVEVVFEGGNEVEVMEAAAEVWCATVLKARSPAVDASTQSRPVPFRVSVLPTPQSHRG